MFSLQGRFFKPFLNSTQASTYAFLGSQFGHQIPNSGVKVLFKSWCPLSQVTSSRPLVRSSLYQFSVFIDSSSSSSCCCSTIRNPYTINNISYYYLLYYYYYYYYYEGKVRRKTLVPNCCRFILLFMHAEEYLHVQISDIRTRESICIIESLTNCDPSSCYEIEY